MDEAALLQEIQDAEAGGTSRGKIEVAPICALFDQADEHLAVARAEQAREQAAAGDAAAADEHLRILALSDDKGRIALRMAGTSRKEHAQLTKTAEADRAAGRREASDARVAAGRAALDAWKTVRESPYTAVLGVAEHRAPDVDTLVARLAEMRETKVPARAQQRRWRPEARRTLPRPSRHGQGRCRNATDRRRQRPNRTDAAGPNRPATPGAAPGGDSGTGRDPAGSGGQDRPHRAADLSVRAADPEPIRAQPRALNARDER
ncbi:hypothetical protein [Streptomyces sp. NPDC088726]|uniref:hypothetical protein n=1 Tax=Streptomyces sp. NPDC088726 TaxID=3365874 RepID=UPI00381CEF5F